MKPRNILVDLRANVVKLTDYGVARELDHSRTRSGLVLGSPEYMASEVLAGGDAGPATDLRALGPRCMNCCWAKAARGRHVGGTAARDCRRASAGLAGIASGDAAGDLRGGDALPGQQPVRAPAGSHETGRRTGPMGQSCARRRFLSTAIPQDSGRRPSWVAYGSEAQSARVPLEQPGHPIVPT